MNKNLYQKKNAVLRQFMRVVGIGILLWMSGFSVALADSSQSCLERCIRSHPRWGQFVCSEGAEFYIVGKGCYEIQNECALSCNSFREQTVRERYIPQREQLTNQWRHQNTCSPNSQKMPLEFLPGDHLIAPEWQGRCECLNGKLVLGKCGHRKTSCNKVCDLGHSF